MTALDKTLAGIVMELRIMKTACRDVFATHVSGLEISSLIRFAVLSYCHANLT